MPVDQDLWVWRLILWLERQTRPYLGWGVLVACVTLAALPAMALHVNQWLDLGSLQPVLDSIGPAAVLVVWWMLGWRGPPPRRRGRSFRLALGSVAVLVIGILILTQLMIGWLPGPSGILRTVHTGDWVALSDTVVSRWASLLARFALWWKGVLSGGAAQDNLVFTTVGGLIIWAIGAITGWLARSMRQGILASAPSLWLLTAILLYSSTGRMLLVGALAVTICLQLMLDQRALMERWQTLGLDFSPAIFIDRLFAVMAGAGLVLVVAALMPNLYVRPLVVRYYEIMSPLNRRMETYAERLFPDVKGTSRIRGGGLAGGLPNQFLLQEGPQLSSAEVMRVRTNEASASDSPYEYPSGEQPPPPGHYMRGGTFSTYDGHGWTNGSDVRTDDLKANERRPDVSLSGRKLVVQSVTLAFNTQVLYAAPEPIEASVDTRLQYRAPGNIVALLGRDQSYTAVSAVPAVDQAMMDMVPAWDAQQPLPQSYEDYLQLPDTVTDRTRQLASKLTQGITSPFEKGQAIERYLRSYQYDLTVPKPPADVKDVADYFLFDLRRGYCDYYATAFVVLARLAGLPARFATGFAVGHWDPVNGQWIVTEAESHSWPEVYFAEYGWIPFEPTAGRPELTRIAQPSASNAGSIALPPPPAQPEEVPTAVWSWQVLLWVVVLGLIVWGTIVTIGRWQASREDPWQGLLRWGRWAGRPIGDGETVLEYGTGLADYVRTHQSHIPDTGRIVAKEVLSLSSAVSTVHYGPAATRSRAITSAMDHWQRLRGYLRVMRLDRR